MVGLSNGGGWIARKIGQMTKNSFGIQARFRLI
jgi:hypothetical protein